MIKRIIAVLVTLVFVYVMGGQRDLFAENGDRAVGMAHRGLQESVGNGGKDLHRTIRCEDDIESPAESDGGCTERDPGRIIPVPVTEEKDELIGVGENQDYSVTKGCTEIPENTEPDGTADGFDSDGSGESEIVDNSGGIGEDGVELATDIATLQDEVATSEPEVQLSEEDATFTEEVQLSEPQYLGCWAITAYCPCEQCCGVWAGGSTSSGVPAVAGHTIACNCLPFGAKVMIDGIVYTVEDTGYTPFGDEWIDIYFDTHEEAEAWGVQTKEVYLVG